MKNILFIIFSILALAACSFEPIVDKFEDVYSEVTAPDYVNSSKSEKLEVPPDLSEFEASSSYGVPGDATSYKDFNGTKILKPKLIKVIDDPQGIHLVKSGNLRWLIIKKDPDTIWPFLETFWENMGFTIKKVNKRMGVMETEWIRADDVTGDNSMGMGQRLDKWLDDIGGKEDKRKFRTRIERGSQVGTTEIYLSHRRQGTEGARLEERQRIIDAQVSQYTTNVYAIEEYKGGNEKDSGDGIPFNAKTEIQDFEINSEVLRRLMVYLGVANLDAEQKFKNPKIIQKAELVEESDSVFVKLDDRFDRSWRRLSIALDLIGFVTEDKNRSEGVFYVKYKDLDFNANSDKDGEANGILDTLVFWDNDDSDDSDDLVTSTPYGDIRSKSNKKNKKQKQEDENPVVNEPGDALGIFDDSGAGATPIWNFDLWGSDEEEGLESGEKRYRIKLIGSEEGSKVYVESADGVVNNSRAANAIVNILFEHLR